MYHLHTEYVWRLNFEVIFLIRLAEVEPNYMKLLLPLYTSFLAIDTELCVVKRVLKLPCLKCSIMYMLSVTLNIALICGEETVHCVFLFILKASFKFVLL
jgi:hypothetical protein